MKFPLIIQKLIAAFSHFPTVGPKTAERYVFYLLKKSPEELNELAQDIAELKEKITICSRCRAYAEKNPCSVCSDPKRDRSVIAVVADTRDLLALEATREYNGLYYVLGGHLDAIRGLGPETLALPGLIDLIKAGGIKEAILSLGSDLPGEATALYLAKTLKPYQIKITRLAKGLPVGANLEYADEITLANALKHRNEV